MKKDLRKKQSQELLRSQDTKYYIKTASKMAAVPLVSLILIGYSVSLFIDLNHSFFIANGLIDTESVKMLFNEKMYMSLSKFLGYFIALVVVVFGIGLFLAHLALKPYRDIEKHAINSINDKDDVFSFSKLNSGKVVYQAGAALFNYVAAKSENSGVHKSFKVPKDVLNVKSPTVDKTFLLEYLALSVTSLLLTSFVMYGFFTEVYYQLTANATEMLDVTMITTRFIAVEYNTLNSIFLVALSLNIVLYVLLSGHLVKITDGVSYAFCRDIRDYIQGDNNKSINLRKNDPGQSAAISCNELIEYCEESSKSELPQTFAS